MIVVNDYALALYELSAEDGTTDLILEETKAVLEVLKAVPEYTTLIDSPAVPKPQRLGLLDEAFGSLSRFHLNFLKILCEKHSVRQYEACASEFQRLYDEAHGILRATAITATAMTEQQSKTLTGKLEQMTGKTVLLQNKVDPTVLGGMTLRFGGVQLDGSLRSRLEDLRQRLAQAIV